MAQLSLAEAATLTGKSKSTLTRAIKSGRMSAVRRADGTFALDPAEVLRVFPHDAVQGLSFATGEASALLAQQAENNALRADLAKAEQRAAVADALADERARALDAAERNLSDLRRLLPPAPSASAVRPWWRFW